MVFYMGSINGISPISYNFQYRDSKTYSAAQAGDSPQVALEKLKSEGIAAQNETSADFSAITPPVETSPSNASSYGAYTTYDNSGSSVAVDAFKRRNTKSRTNGLAAAPINANEISSRSDEQDTEPSEAEKILYGSTFSMRV